MRTLRRLTLTTLLICGTSCLISCGTKILIVDPLQGVVRIGPGVRGRVFVKSEGKWVLTQNKVSLQGWYATRLLEEPDDNP